MRRILCLIVEAELQVAMTLNNAQSLLTDLTELNSLTDHEQDLGSSEYSI